MTLGEKQKLAKIVLERKKLLVNELAKDWEVEDAPLELRAGTGDDPAGEGRGRP